MADVKWIKLTTDMFDDEKIDFITSLPESDAIIVIWIRLLSLAGKCNAGGYIYLTEKIPYTDDMLSHKFRKPINIIKLALETFRNLGMIEYVEGVIFIPNWGKHQNVDGMEKIREQTRIRTSNYREKLRKLPSGDATCDATVTNGDAIELELELELDKEVITTVVILSPEENEFISTLESIKDYPIDRVKDLEMYKTLQSRYPTLNIVAAIKDWSFLKLDNPLKGGQNPRSQINTSMKKNIDWGKNLKQTEQPKRNIRM